MKLFSSLKRLTWRLCLVAGLFLVAASGVSAQECKENACPAGDQACWSRARTDCQNKIREAQQQAKTLSSAISVLNGQVALQQLQVNQTTAEIVALEKEIVELSQRIEGLGYSLDRLGTVLIERVREQYKQGRSEPRLHLLGADSLSELMARLKYLSVAQRQTADTMQRTETQRLEYDEQKQLKEEKQRELDTKRRQVEQEKQAVTQKRTEQQNLLAVTNNSERQYQSLLAQANSQLASFSSFASASQGGASILTNQTRVSDWGTYYSQRDAQWGNMSLGGSGYTVAQAGCLITSMAMIATHYGKSLDPGQITTNTSIFQGAGLLSQGAWTVNGVTMARNPVCNSSSCLDEELEGGRPAIVRINTTAGTHFVVILKKEGDSYIMHDPVIANGHDRKFTDHYSLGSITRVDRVSVQ